MAIERIGFIGIGNMGAPMAANLVKAGFAVSVFDARAEAVRELARGHRVAIAASLAEIGANTDCVITMLPDDKAVRSVILGDGADCVAATLEAGKIVVDMSTSNPAATRALGAALSYRGVRVIDACVTGDLALAREGSLDIMAGGDAAAIKTLMPVFSALGRQVFVCGPLGSAHALKAIANYVNACTLVNVVEALSIGRKFGLHTATMIESMRATCTGRNHPLETKVIPHMLTRKYASGTALDLVAKDLQIAIDAARESGAIAPLAERVHELWQNAAREIGATADQTEILRYWERLSDIEL